MNDMCIYTPRTEDVLPVREIWQKSVKSYFVGTYVGYAVVGVADGLGVGS